MSYENRQEDKDKILSLDIGGEYYFNMFQDGGAMIECGGEGVYNLYEIPLYGGKANLSDVFTKDKIDAILDEVYNTWL